MAIPKMKCPIECIQQNDFEKLRLREQAYIVLTYERCWDEKEIMARLFFDRRNTFRYFKKRIKRWITQMYNNGTQIKK